VARRPGRAVRCRARAKSTGQPCGCYAIVGASVCRVHGGGSQRVRRAANLRLLQEWAVRSSEAQTAAHRRRLVAWHADRIIATAEVLGLDVATLLRDPVKAQWKCSDAHRLRPDLVPSILDEPKFRLDLRYRAPKAAVRDC
jgi:hypothetical protein